MGTNSRSIFKNIINNYWLTKYFNNKYTVYQMLMSHSIFSQYAYIATHYFQSNIEREGKRVFCIGVCRHSLECMYIQIKVNVCTSTCDGISLSIHGTNLCVDNHALTTPQLPHVVQHCKSIRIKHTSLRVTTYIQECKVYHSQVYTTFACR